MTTEATKGKRTRLTDRDLAELVREGRTPEDIATATGYTAPTIRGRLRDLGIDDAGQPMTQPAPTRRNPPVVAWYGDGDESWRDLAACATGGHALDTFFPVGPHDSPLVAEAKRICRGCPVSAKCLDVALKAEGTSARDSRAGIFGGLTVNERVALGREAVA